MPKQEWFRRTTWTPQDRAAFYARLNRSRTRFHKAQYLRIQAGHLAEVGTEPMLRAAVGLLDHLLQDFPEPSELACAHWQRGRCLADLGDHEGAIQAYRMALDVQRAYPNALTIAHLDFAELVITLNRRELFPEVSAVLDEFGRSEMFPFELFKREAARAIIAFDANDRDTARLHAQRALAAASATDSGFRYHKKLGLVGFLDPKLADRLRAISAA